MRSGRRVTDAQVSDGAGTRLPVVRREPARGGSRAPSATLDAQASGAGANARTRGRRRPRARGPSRRPPRDTASGANWKRDLDVVLGAPVEVVDDHPERAA